MIIAFKTNAAAEKIGFVFPSPDTQRDGEENLFFTFYKKNKNKIRRYSASFGTNFFNIIIIIITSLLYRAFSSIGLTENLIIQTAF